MTEIHAMVERARTMASPQAEALLIEASNRLLNEGKRKEASRLLKSIDSTMLPAVEKSEHIMALARLAMMQEDYSKATELLTTDTMGLLAASATLDAERLNRISLLRAQAWEAQDNYLAAARERIFVAPMLESPERYTENHTQIWQDLISVPTDTLEQLSRTIAIPEIQGWLELAWIYKGQQDNLDRQLKELKHWQQQFAGHPAARQLPDSLRILTEMSDSKPQHIALLLPLQGKYRQSAIAIQNGFMTAHYMNASQQTEDTGGPDIQVYDTSDLSQFSAIYQRAVDAGADIIIGPLQKENVHQLAASTQELPVPTIALNTDDSTTETPANLYQFGLSPEDDAHEVAIEAQRNGFSRAAVLYQLSPWGERANMAFGESWSAGEGTVNVATHFDIPQSLATSVKHMLLVDQSDARAQQLKRILGKGFEFQPRRRQDIDFIYLIASPEQGRQIKPLLNFYFADGLPVYSGSQIFSGEPAPDKDRDLDGINFCDIPWMLDKPDTMKKSMLTAWPNSNPRFFRLNALGVDAYRLQTRLQLFQNVPGAGLFGATGTLTINEQRRVQRGLAWAVMKAGTPRKAPKIVDTTAMEPDGKPTAH